MSLRRSRPVRLRSPNGAHSAAKRQKKMYELAARMEERSEHFAMLDTIDSGNPLTGMRGDAQKAPGEIRHFANMASEIKGIVRGAR